MTGEAKENITQLNIKKKACLSSYLWVSSVLTIQKLLPLGRSIAVL